VSFADRFAKRSLPGISSSGAALIERADMAGA
jgi:hypothetical protein